nr:N-acetylneuraminate synthase family protein [uncultured Methanospirillum sp.]
MTNNKKTYIIAEIGMNHDGSIGQAKAFIDAAAEIGVSAVKFQTHIADAETLFNAPGPAYFQSESRYNYFKRTAFSLEEHIQLKIHAEKAGVDFISSPFSLEAVDLLEQVGVKKYKVPSGEITNIPLLEKIAKTGKQILLSSGMSNFLELDEAYQIIKDYHSDIVVMQCSSQYPCPYEEAGLNIIQEIKERYRLPIGFSDHTTGIAASLAAVVLGATVVEKHFTISNKLYGPDSKNSLEPDDFRRMIEGIRQIEIMMNNPVDKNDLSKYHNMKYVFQKSIVSCMNIQAGTIITPEIIALKKPGGGLSPRYYSKIMGKKTNKDILKDSTFDYNDIDWE